MKRNKRFWAIPLLTLLLVGTAQASEMEPPFQGYIVKLEENPASVRTMGLDVDTQQLRELPFGYHKVETLEELEALQEAGLVVSVEKDYEVVLHDSYPNDYYYNVESTSEDYKFYQYALDMIGMGYIWEQGYTGAGVTIGIVDSGLMADHPDMDYSKIQSSSYDYYDDDADYTDEYTSSYHGSMVAGIIGATTNNEIGVASIAPGADLVILKVFGSDTDPSPSLTTIASAIKAGVDAGCDVINMSVGSFGSDASSYLQTAIDYAIAADVILVSSAGNGYLVSTDVYDYTSYSYPASMDGVISVGAVDSDGVQAYYSQENDMVDVVAPGTSITGLYLSTTNGLTYARNSGTSFASPMVAAIAALALEVNPDLTAAEFMTLIETTSVDNDAADGWDIEYGHGLIQADAIVKALEADLAPQGTATQGEAGVTVTVQNLATDYAVDSALTAIAAGYDATGKLLAVDLKTIQVGAGGRVAVDDFNLDLTALPTTVKVTLLDPTTWAPVGEVLQITPEPDVQDRG